MPLDIGFATLLVVNVALLVPMAGLASRRAFGRFSGTILDPLVIAGLIHAVFVLDFVLLYAGGRVTLFERPVPAGDSGIFEGFAIYSMFALSATAGMAIGARSARPTGTRFAPVAQDGRRLSGVVLLLVLVGAAVVLRQVLSLLPLLLAGAINKQRFFLGNQLMLVLVSILTPSFALFVTFRQRASWAVVGGAMAVGVVVTLAGSRSFILFVGVILAAMAIRSGTRLRARLYTWILPTGMAALTYLRYLFRESWRYDSFAEFIAARGGVVAVLFRSSEIGLAEGLTAVWVRLPALTRPPFESMLGAAMYPLPRAWFPFKPLSASGYLTAELSPHHWTLTSSEILSSGYGDLTMQFGPVIGALAAMLVGYLYVRGAATAMTSDGWLAVLLTPFIIWWYLLFMRTSIFHLGASVWSLSLVLAGFLALGWLSRGWRELQVNLSPPGHS